MTARSTALRRWRVWVVLALDLLVTCSCTWAQITPTMPLYTLQPTLASTLLRSPTILKPMAMTATPTSSPRPSTTPIPLLTGTLILMPWCTATPLPTARTTPLALSWSGPLIVPAQLPPSSSDEVLIPIFDVGNGRSAQVSLTGCDKVHIDGWSADGCFLIVSCHSPGGEEVAKYLVNVETGMSRFLLGDAYKVIFSPDGKWIAYDTPKERADMKQRIYVVRADGSEPAKLVTEDPLVGLKGWTADSRKLLYWTEEGSYAVEVDSMERCLTWWSPDPLKRWEDLYLADPVTCERIPLALSVNLETVVWWVASAAPGGRYMALFLGEEEMGGDFAIEPSRFFVVDLKTGEEHMVTEEPFGMSNLWDWSPDGTYLALVADFSEGWSVYLVEAATGQRRKLNVGPALSPSWSPDGRWLALQSLERDPPYASAPSLIYDLETEAVIYLPAEFGYSMTPQPQPLLWSPRLSYENERCR